MGLGSHIGFIGAGRAGAALALGLSQAGYQVTAVASRSRSAAEALAVKVQGAVVHADPACVVADCDLVLLTVPDDAIAPLAASLPWRNGQGVVHCSGALSSEALASARERGSLVGCMHPLQTFADRSTGVQRLAGSAFAVEGEGALGDWLEEAARALGGCAVHIRPEDRALYHASAVMACGYVTTLLDAAVGLWEAMGFSQEEGLQALLPLVKGTIANLEQLGTMQGATGPILRGDVGTVQRHLESMERQSPQASALYCQLGLAMVQLALRRGSINDTQADELQQVLQSKAPSSETHMLSPVGGHTERG